MFRLLLVVFLMLAPLAAAQEPAPSIDATITLSPTAGPIIDAPPGLVLLENETPGERYELGLALTQPYTTLEVRANGFDIERAKQIVPMLALPETEFPLFEPYPDERIWEAEGAVTVYHTSGTPDAVVLRLGVAGPRNVTLVLSRDVTPPTFELGEVQSITHYSFYQEANASELSIGDLQVREAGADAWIPSPTPVFHFRQRFPIQGLHADTEYEAQLVVTDWAGNQAASDIYRVRSAPAPVGPAITITPLSPAPNATVMPGSVSIRASVESPGAAIASDGVRVFFDLKEVTPDIELVPGEVVYTPRNALAAGMHRVSIEAVNEAGGKGLAKWSFTVEGPSNDTPLPAFVVPVALLVALALRRR